MCHFNPRPPCGVRHDLTPRALYHLPISIHAPRVGCDADGKTAPPRKAISIHAPRAGCDTIFSLHVYNKDVISIHAPRAGCDLQPGELPVPFANSIHAPRAGCDDYPQPKPRHREHFNPRTPCGVRHPVQRQHDAGGGISIHAPRAGCDSKFDGFTRQNLRKRYKKVSVQPKKRAKKKIKEMLCSHSHIFGWISGAKVPEFPAR